MEKKGNGHDPLTVELVDLLRQVVNGINGTNTRLDAFRDEMRGELTDIRGELREMHHEMAATNERVTLTNERLEDLRAELHGLRGDMKGAVETRLARLEGAVFKRA